MFRVYQLSFTSTWPWSREHQSSIISKQELVNRRELMCYRYVYWSSLSGSRTRVSKIPNPLDKSRQFHTRVKYVEYECAHRLHVPPQYFWISTMTGSNEVKGCAFMCMHAYEVSLTTARGSQMLWKLSKPSFRKKMIQRPNFISSLLKMQLDLD